MGRAPALILLLLAACSGGAGPGGGEAPDAAPDADLVSFSLAGDYLDWDSTAAAPCPIPDGVWAARYDSTRTATTDAAGAFTIRLASYLWELDVTPPAAPPACAAGAASPYELPATALVPPAVHFAGGRFGARAMTRARAASFYATFLSAFDATRAHLLVHVDGPPREVAISSPHAGAQAFDGAAWGAGATGADVFFPNIDLAGDEMTTVSVTGGAVGTGSVVLRAGALLYMTVVAR